MLLDPYWRTRSPRALPSGLDWSELRIQLQSNPITSLEEDKKLAAKIEKLKLTEGDDD